MPMPTAEPFQAFAYLDIDHPVVAWGAYRGVMVSAHAEARPPEAPVSMMFAGMIQHENNARLHNEFLIERVRAEKFSQQVSRLTGMYFFTDVAQAEAALPWGGHFRTENLAELEVHPVGPFRKVDANWITHAKLDGNGRIDTAATEWIEKYWAGEPFSDSPVWETIVDGRAIILGTELRQRAYNHVAQAFPNALDTLEVARLAAAVDSDLGQTTAWITRTAADRFRLAYYLDMRDAEKPEFLGRLGKHEGPRNLKDLAPGKETFGLPDFRPFGCEFAASALDRERSGPYRVHRELGI
jgi:hypothetical protein